MLLALAASQPTAVTSLMLSLLLGNVVGLEPMVLVAEGEQYRTQNRAAQRSTEQLNLTFLSAFHGLQCYSGAGGHSLP
jgi:hypothetical protein